VENAQAGLRGCSSVDIDLAEVDRIAGAVSLARLPDRVEANGGHAHFVEGKNPKATRLISLCRSRWVASPMPQASFRRPLARVGALAAQLPGNASEALDLIGRCAAALPKVAAKPLG
jgi:hypothetical protein